MLKKFLISFLSISLILFGANIALYSQSSKAEIQEDISTVGVEADFETVKLKDVEEQDLTKKEEKKLNEVFEEYNLEKVDFEEINLSQNTEVLNFDSVKEFEKYMEEIQEPVHIDIDEENKNTSIAFLDKLVGNNTASAAPVTYKAKANAGFGNIVLYAKVEKNSKKIITKTTVWTDQEGITLGIGWDQKYAYANLNSKKTGGTAYGGGTCSRHIFVKGIGTVSKRSVELTKKF